MQIAEWQTNGRRSIHIGRVRAFTIGAGMDVMPWDLKELCADIWTLQVKSPWKLTYHSCIITFQMKYSVKHRFHILVIHFSNFYPESDPTVTINLHVIHVQRHQIKVWVLRKQNFISFLTPDRFPAKLYLKHNPVHLNSHSVTGKIWATYLSHLCNLTPYPNPLGD